MDYSKGLKALRKTADNFDYEKYSRDVSAGKFAKKAKTAQEIGQEGLMRRKAQALDVPDIEEEAALGPMAERYLQLRNRRGGQASSIASAVKEAMEYKEDEDSTGVKSSEGLMRPRERSWSESDDFISKLIKSESSGRTDAEYQTRDGERYVGLGQFGEDRLTDFKRYTNTEFTQDEFKSDPKLQEEVMKWHVRDIDKAIGKLKGADRFDKDGLRAVAHLGGLGGMRQFVASGGKHNPSDELGTSLSKYYNKFKG
jgi:hypothetical protein